MALAAGVRLGSYEIVSALGAGGMGEVYRAHDTKLGRDVALKIVPDSFTHDPERLARFRREAQVLAALNHPNIAQIHGLDEANGTQFLVLELVDGEGLDKRIARGPIPVDEALIIAKQMAEALDAAHEKGIIHRDLKPANIALTKDAQVKVLDFGLAKATDAANGTSADFANSPTITSPAMMTNVGAILGTAAYMSPEQAKGRAADKRCDVWAFGCVLYEMLAGKRAFDGDDVSETLAAVLRGEPDWAALPADVPASVRTLLTGCLAKDRRHRIGGMSAALFVINHQAALVAFDAPIHPATAVPRPLWRTAIPVVAVIIVGLAAGYGGWRLKPAAPGVVTRFAIVLSDRSMAGAASGPSLGVAVSPDGTRLAYTANDRLYLRALDQLEPAPIAGVESPGLSSPRSPFFSPDGQWLGFWHASQLKKVPVSGGAPVTVCSCGPPPLGAAWAADDSILFVDYAAGIFRMSANGGTPERIVKVDAGQHAFGPQLMPDGRTVLFTLFSEGGNDAQVVVQSLDRGTRRTVTAGGTNGRYLPTGHLVYAVRGTVLAVRFDPASLSIKGSPVPVVEGVWQPGGPLYPSARFAVSLDGTLAYVPAGSFTVPRRTLAWVDRQGREEAIAAPPRVYSHPRLSPDGTRLALQIEDDNQKVDIWTWDLRRGGLTRVTAEPTDSRHPAWTPDGQRLIFNRANYLFWQAASGSGTAERVSERFKGSVLVPHTMSTDGRRLVLRGVGEGGGGSNLLILDVGEGRSVQPSEPRPLMATSFEEYNAEISPNGRWLAYQSNSSGAFEVYVRPFPDVASGRWLVSTAGGTEPLWARDGRELFYRTPEGAVMGVAIAPGSTWTAGSPAKVLEAKSYALGGSVAFAAPYRTYDVSPDGRRFLMIKNAEAQAQASTAPGIVVVQHWFEELNRLVPAK